MLTQMKLTTYFILLVLYTLFTDAQISPGGGSSTVTFILSSSSSVVPPTNPCTTGTDDCMNIYATCIPIGNTGYSCQCSAGYVGTGRGESGCTDFNECSNSTTNVCQFTDQCTNEAGSFRCSCPAGYTLDGLHSCKDNDECLQTSSICSQNSNCTNTIGSYVCSCHDGYQKNGDTCIDINECDSLSTNQCVSPATCQNIVGSFLCNCPQGYTGSGTLSCQNINECLDPTLNSCDANAICTDTEGSYQCLCKNGYTGTGTTCTDINECLSTPCAASQDCQNLAGGYSCNCKLGYTVSGSTCIDINECLSPSTNLCVSPATCLNNNGSYTCECPQGYTVYNQYQCRDIDECTTSDICSTNTRCENTLGGYNCICDAGYEIQGNSCQDINECLLPTLNLCNSNAVCTNNIASYSCQCNAGYEGNGIQCTNINECLTTNNCSSAADCTDTDGSYTCSCKTAYTGDGFKCTDNNECLQTACSQICINTPGSYQCGCNVGYTFVAPHDCQDINECSDSNLNDCDVNALCSNTVGSFTCQCNSGFLGDGKFCVVDRFVPYETCNYITDQDKGHQTYRVQSTTGIPFGSTIFNDIYFCINGFISLGENKCEEGPEANLGQQLRSTGNYIAPFWSDIDLTLPSNAKDSTSNRVYYCVYGELSNSADAVTAKSNAQKTIRTYSSDLSFNGTTVIIATWYQVNPFDATIHFNSNKVATFQAVLVSDFKNTYVYFVYFNMLWKLFAPVQVGYRSSLNTISVVPEVTFPPYHYLQFDKAPGNVGVDGLWLFQVSNETITVEKQRCDAWSEQTISSNVLNNFLASRNTQTKRRMSCPCCIQQAVYDGRYKAEDNALRKKVRCVYNINTKTNCPSLVNTGPFCIQRKNVWNSGLKDTNGDNIIYATRCCYDTSSGGLIRTISSSSEPLTQNYLMPSTSRTPKERIRQEAIDSYLQPYSDCCLNSVKCTQYQDRTVIPNCFNFKPRDRAPAYGDPHIITLDGLSYTFNGLGDYYMLLSTDLQIQSRTCLISGATNSATVFCGYAMKETNSSKIEVYLNNGATKVLVDGISQNLTTLASSETTSYTDVDLTYEVDENSTVITVDFQSGCSIEISVFKTFLQSVVSYPDDGDETSGLLGKKNGNQNDDLTALNGTILSVHSNEESIYYNFGQTWLVSANSMFTDSHSGLSPNFLPLFFTTLEDLFRNKPTVLANATRICGNSTTNRACYFDFAVTGDETLSTDGNVFVNTAEDITQLINIEPPAITGPTVLNVTFNETSRYFITATSNSSSNFTYFLSNHTSNFVLIDNKTGEFEFTPQGTIDKVVLGAIDTNGLSGIFQPTISSCNCQNGGTCDQTQFEFEHNSTFDAYYQWKQCICPVGYNGPFCENIVDVCVDHPCFFGVTCTVVTNGFDRTAECEPCPDGYSGDGRKCYDVDDCALPTNDCEQLCQNVLGSYYCECNTGYNLRTDNKTCEDINECNNATVCPNSLEKCGNTNGSYECQCINGYRKDGSNNCLDIDECQENTDGCQQICLNNNGSYSCGCDNGFTLDKDNTTCADINECDNNTSNCHEYATCSNTIGSFTCQCNNGFTGNGTACSDLNECNATVRAQLGVSECNATCTNTIGSYQCSCPSDYQLSIDGINCLQLNPCLSASDGCDVNAVCSYGNNVTKCTCLNGFTGNGTSCIDVNECQASHGCSQDCNNTVGSFICSCTSGHVLDADARTCNDVNECIFGLSNCDVNSKCNNTIGSFFCNCNDGYQKNGTACQDIDECQQTPSPCDQKCTNNPSSYVCSCNSGYDLISEVCVNQDECSLTTDDCHSNATCSDTVGSFTCTCKTGFSGNGTFCEDVNECLNVTHGCKLESTVSSQVCSNEIGSFSCVCPPGYSLQQDGKTCLDKDECLLGTDNCTSGQKCFNNLGSFECRDVCPGNCQQLCNETSVGFKCYCQPGYQVNALQTNLCEDINECNGVNDCHSTADCVNTNGTYICRCPVDYTGDPRTGCTAIITTTTVTPLFPNGYKYTSGNLNLYNVQVNGEAIDATDSRLTDTTSELYQNIVNYLETIIAQIFEGITITTINVQVVILSPGVSTEVKRKRRATVSPLQLTYRVRFEETFNLNMADLKSSLNTTLSSTSFWLNNTAFAALVIPSSVAIQDENECTSGIHKCDANAICTNTEFTYTCTCKSDYDGNGFTCVENNDDTDLLIIILPIVLGGLLFLIIIIVLILVVRRRRRGEIASEANDSLDGASHTWAPFPSGKMRARSMYLPTGIVPTQYRDIEDH